MYTVEASWNIYPQDAFIQKELSSGRNRPKGKKWLENVSLKLSATRQMGKVFTDWQSGKSCLMLFI